MHALKHERPGNPAEASQVRIRHAFLRTHTHTYLYLCVLANLLATLLLLHQRITNPLCRRRCRSGTSGTELLCWELFALPGLLTLLSSMPPPNTHTVLTLPLPLPFFHSPSVSLSLASPYAQNLRLISSQCWPVCSRSITLFFVRARVYDSAGLSEVQGRRWRASNVTLLLVIAVEWPGLTASSAPRPSTVSGSIEVKFYCWPAFQTLPLQVLYGPTPCRWGDCTLLLQRIVFWILLLIIYYFLVKGNNKIFCS